MLNYVFMTQTNAGRTRIGNMRLDTVGFIQYRGNAALGIECGALIEVAFAKYGDAGKICCFQGKGETGSTATNDQDIEL